MSRKKERFSTIEELGLSAMSRGISPGRLASEVGFPWKGHRIVLTEDGTFHFFRDGREVAPPDFLVDISEISKEICDETTEKVVIPDSVTIIGDDAFSYCRSLTSLTIPSGVTSIGEDAFYGCSCLTSVTIPDSVTSIMEYAFSYCTSLTSVTIPESVTSIGWYVFEDCRGLSSVTIGNGVTSIGWYAFGSCPNLMRITIPRKLKNCLEKIGIDRDKTKVSFSC